MSGQGVHSSRGDAYQSLIAAEWAIAALYQEIAWIEIDSTSLDSSGLSTAVDDIVVRFSEGGTLYCQCKKNHPQHGNWTPASLREDLTKAGLQLARDPAGRVRFYSRNNFGNLSALAEHARVQADAAAFARTMPSVLQDCLDALQEIWGSALANARSTVWTFLRRLQFEVTPDFEALRARQLGTLRLHATRADRVHERLIARVDAITRRLGEPGDRLIASNGGRLTKDDVFALIAEAGASRTPLRLESELAEQFRRTSAIGRQWLRQIAGQRLERVGVRENLRKLIKEKSKTILIEAGPGFGKTCVLLDLVEDLEANSACFSIYVQGREFAHCHTEQERLAVGLPSDLVGLIARAAELRHVVVVIDSLDVLSLAREHAALEYFLGLVDRLAAISNTTVVAACRSFDLKYDQRLGCREWTMKLVLGPLEWQTEVLPLLTAWGVKEDQISTGLRELLRNPRMLALYSAVVQRGGAARIETEQDLVETYLDVVVRRKAGLGDSAMGHLSDLAARMVSERRLDMSALRSGIPSAIEQPLKSAEILIEPAPGQIAFAHQTLLDMLAVWSAMRQGQTLTDFVRNQPQTPFVRPSVRTFFLRTRDPRECRKQVWSVLESEHVSFHMKRLIVESLADVDPTDDDWSLLQHLWTQSRPLFDSFLARIRTPAWFRLLGSKWLPGILEDKDAAYFEWYANRVALVRSSDPTHVIDVWQQGLQFEWADRDRLRATIALEARELDFWRSPGARRIVELLVDSAGVSRDLSAKAVCTYVEATDSGDDLLWRYVVSGIESADPSGYTLIRQLRCGLNVPPMPEFLPDRMVRSDALLDLAVTAVEEWSVARIRTSNHATSWNNALLAARSMRLTHKDPADVLIGAIEAACLERAACDSPWWRDNENRLQQSTDGALRSIALKVYAKHPATNVAAIAAVFRDVEMLADRSFLGEMRELIRSAFVLLDELEQDELEERLRRVGGELGLTKAEFVARWRRELLSAIPAFLRTVSTQRYLDEIRRMLPYEGAPTGNGPWREVGERFATEGDLLTLSHDALLSLLNYIEASRGEGAPMAFDSVYWPLSQAVSRNPARYLSLLGLRWFDIARGFRADILRGASNHLLFRFGNLTADKDWKPVSQPDGADLSAALLSELESHWSVWGGTMEAMEALKACAHGLDLARDAERLAFLLVRTWTVAGPDSEATDDDLLTPALNSARGVAAEASVILAGRLAEAQVAMPTLLRSTLLYFSADASESIRALFVRYLAWIQVHAPDLGWQCFARVIDASTPRIWSEAERCLYNAYHRDFGRVAPYLSRLEFGTSDGPGGATWGRISALAVLSGHLALDAVLEKLRQFDSSEAWQGAAAVFATNAHQRDHTALCFSALQRVFDEGGGDAAREEFGMIFRAKESVAIPLALLRSYFEVLARLHGAEAEQRLHEFPEWLLRLTAAAPMDALAAAEIALGRGPATAVRIWDPDLFPTLLTKLFREAEDREQADGGALLKRVIAFQDLLLKANSYRIDDWLRDAERP